MIITNSASNYEVNLDQQTNRRKGMKPTESLREDHQVILRMCKVLNSLANKIKDGKSVAAAPEACAAGDDEARLKFAGNARSYAELLVPHIDKEDNILYPMCDEVL